MLDLAVEGSQLSFWKIKLGDDVMNKLASAILVGVVLLVSSGASAAGTSDKNWGGKGWQERPTRLPDVPESAYSPEQKQAVDNAKQRFNYLNMKDLAGPMRIYARNPLVLEGAANLIDADVKAANLGHRLTRFVGTVVAGFWRAQYEWFAQSREAEREGIDPAVIEAIRLGKTPQFTKPDERLVYETVREITETKTLSPASFQRARAMLGDQAAAELLNFTAFFTMVAITCVSFDIQAPEPFPARPLPPLGRTKHVSR